MKRASAGQDVPVEETTNAAPHASPEGSAAEPVVGHVVEGDTARLTVSGELTDTARRPLVRIVTDLLLAEQSLRRLELDLREVTFMGSAGLAVLVQLQKLGVPRAIETVLVEPPPSVARPLQLTGLWHRFTIVEADGGGVAEQAPDGGPGSRGTEHS
ncbi:STAS domain-containing protein [Blastococcus xanthinilyticus]|uniref:Anti-sigma factor antagonist n=1 Tax=Blastococcus xanthinilyticus TaxID=1564164 RepID=A0A5S5D414_9ACTN|nr:STAS domain-containing protein [Blastococcus xanthinilyticus]TYP90690.1 stage II sporulation protein AA (anti-sigma F factor antagonist) [Blastococcus xanthinilyticus]